MIIIYQVHCRGVIGIYKIIQKKTENKSFYNRSDVSFFLLLGKKILIYYGSKLYRFGAEETMEKQEEEEEEEEEDEEE